MQMNGSFVVNKDKTYAISKISTTRDMLEYIPDVVEYEVVDDSNLIATVKAGVGFIKGKFKTKITLEHSGPGQIRIEGSGSGSNSFMNFTVVVDFKEANDGTEISYDADVNVAGTAATMGQRIIERAATDYVTKIMKKFQASFE